MSKVLSKKDLQRLFRNMALIVVLASAIGLSINSPLLWKVFTGRVVPTKASLPSDPAMSLPLPIELEEVRELINAGALPVDARSREAYLEGHLPGAQALPRSTDDELLETFRQQIPLDRTLIVYCSGYGCTDSFFIAERLLALGYGDVRVFEGGLPEWSDAGLPVAKGQP